MVLAPSLLGQLREFVLHEVQSVLQAVPRALRSLRETLVAIEEWLIDSAKCVWKTCLSGSEDESWLEYFDRLTGLACRAITADEPMLPVSRPSGRQPSIAEFEWLAVTRDEYAQRNAELRRTIIELREKMAELEGQKRVSQAEIVHLRQVVERLRELHELGYHRQAHDIAVSLQRILGAQLSAPAAQGASPNCLLEGLAAKQATSLSGGGQDELTSSHEPQLVWNSVSMAGVARLPRHDWNVHWQNNVYAPIRPPSEASEAGEDVSQSFVLEEAIQTAPRTVDGMTQTDKTSSSVDRAEDKPSSSSKPTHFARVRNATSVPTTVDSQATCDATPRPTEGLSPDVASPSSLSYRQLTQQELGGSTFYMEALRKLKEERQQRRQLRQKSTSAADVLYSSFTTCDLQQSGGKHASSPTNSSSSSTDTAESEVCPDASRCVAV
ncbi:hypothetical protein Poli38472_006799 [Pythium oligandrum]|uniref:Uncharacterized protein n=1 Tax=Pythium oligandrum TaxID=41045 RepID=A0A8K1FDD8_PYTOL|nr:hypothetical protein Poli38472_006799 [Pythium oligandrum]|eukprot:TMW56789.1 hypothetical protein Poli38472_006799 [Pythium oligandrum]